MHFFRLLRKGQWLVEIISLKSLHLLKWFQFAKSQFWRLHTYVDISQNRIEFISRTNYKFFWKFLMYEHLFAQVYLLAIKNYFYVWRKGVKTPAQQLVGYEKGRHESRWYHTILEWEWIPRVRDQFTKRRE